MQAIVATDFGGPEVLKRQEMPDPEPGPRDLLVEVHGTAMNPVDYKVRQGAIPTGRDLPIVLGFDVSGVVRDLGAEVEHFAVGDVIFASPGLNRDGANADYVLVDERTAAYRPETADHVTAATLPLVTLTAWEGLFGHGRLHHQETVLIHGGGGGVGHIAIQLAKDQNCRVITTAGREASLSLCRELGADVVIHYREEDVVQRVMAETGEEGCGVVFETVGGENLKTSIACTAVFGRLVSILGAPSEAPVSDLFIKSASLHFEFMGAANMFGKGRRAQGEILQTAGEYFDAGKLRPHISETYPLEKLAEAHRQQETGHTLGKLAVRVK